MIFAFEVKKRAFLAPSKIGSIDFEFSWLRTFALHRAKVFGIMLGKSSWLRTFALYRAKVFGIMLGKLS
jgi:hypothetical protein